MTPKTLFNIIVKVFGLLFIKDMFDIILQMLPTIIYLVKPELALQTFVTVAIYLLYILAYGLMAYYLIFKSDLVIEKLKLDRDFDQDPFQFNMHRSTVLAISLIVIGGLLIVEGIPTFFGQLGSYYQQTRDRYRQADPPISYMMVSASKVVIGFLIIAEKKRIINFIEKQRQK